MLSFGVMVVKFSTWWLFLNWMLIVEMGILHEYLYITIYVLHAWIIRQINIEHWPELDWRQKKKPYQIYSNVWCRMKIVSILCWTHTETLYKLVYYYVLLLEKTCPLPMDIGYMTICNEFSVYLVYSVCLCQI